MKKINLVSATLLALILILFGANYFVPFIPEPPNDGGMGIDMLQLMREGGLMPYIALSHIGIGILLLIPRFRTLGALLQLPITIGIVCFHLTMLPAGLLFAIILLILNIGALSDLKNVLPLISNS